MSIEGLMSRTQDYINDARSNNSLDSALAAIELLMDAVREINDKHDRLSE
jgi:hypothetical protein